MPVKVIGRIQLPEPAVMLRECPCCGIPKPDSEFGSMFSFMDCHSCEAERFVGIEIPQPPNPHNSNIEAQFYEEWLRELEYDMGIDML